MLLRLSFLTPYKLFPSNTITYNHFWCSRFFEFLSNPIKRVSIQNIAPNIHWSLRTFRLSQVNFNLLQSCIVSNLSIPFFVHFLACSNVSEKYSFRSPKTTDRPFAREDKHQSSMAKPSTVFTESTIQSYQSTDGSHGKLTFSFSVHRFSITRFKTQQLMFFSNFPPSSKNAYCVFRWKYSAIFFAVT